MRPSLCSMMLSLFGITITQTWTYATTNNDRWPLWSLVAFLVCLDFINVVLVSELIKYEFVSSFDNFLSALNIIQLDNYCNPVSFLVNPRSESMFRVTWNCLYDSRYIAFEALFTYIIAFVYESRTFMILLTTKCPIVLCFTHLPQCVTPS